MPYFVDTNFFVALINEDDDYHDRAEEIYVDILNSKYGKLFTSDYVLDEAITVMRVRTKKHDLAVRVGDMISSTVMIKMIYVIANEVFEALNEYKKHDDKDLTFTDWVLVRQIKGRGYHGIVSFDHHFDQVGIKRIH
jgi:predicted nucleic acid-binding protein